jgi:hypothetical protein
MLPALARRFAERRRASLLSALRYGGWLTLVAALLVGATVAPLIAGWWHTAIPAAIGSAIAALLLFAVAVNLPLELIPYVALYIERDDYRPPPPRGFGRMLYRHSGALDALAAEAGLPPLSGFDSHDPLDTREPPAWHAAQAALPTVEHLLVRVSRDLPLHRHLQHLQAALQAARDKEARFFFLVLTWGGGTNARAEAMRRGQL